MLLVVAGDFEPNDYELHSRQCVLNELLAVIRKTYPGLSERKATCLSAFYV